MANLVFIPPEKPVAEIAARHILAHVPSASLARAVVLVPTRRACVTMRRAFQQVLGEKASLLPRMIPLADMHHELLNVLGHAALPILKTIPPAMSDAEQRYHLTQLIAEYERERFGAVSMAYALALADQLMALADQCARAEVALTYEALRPLAHADFATHWEQSLKFLAILSVRWPLLEQEMGMTTQAAREVRVLHALAAHWAASPPNFPVFVVGSTASHAATARLLRVIAESPQGCVMLPGVAPMPVAEWNAITPGHPLYHIQSFLNGWAEPPPVADTPANIWLTALANTNAMAAWKTAPLGDYGHLRLVPCAHAEEEARVVSLLLREALETPEKRTALVTPDEGFMARVSAHMQRYGVQVDRLASGTLASTQSGSLWRMLAAALMEPDRLLLWRSVLHHPCLQVDAGLLREMEPYWHGVSRHKTGQLPRMPEALRSHESMPLLASLLQDGARMARMRLSTSAWVTQCSALLAAFAPEMGEGHEAVAEALETIGHADMLGDLEISEFSAVLNERLSHPWRNGAAATHPQLVMLTPVEARLQSFDRVILAQMMDDHWPGMGAPNAWLNLAASKALGLPALAEKMSLMAHDVLMLASTGEVFLTYARRSEGGPATRSRFIERLVTLLAMQDVAESAITANHYVAWANALYAAAHFTPEPEPRPTPTLAERPARLPVSALDTLCSDPFSVYARHVLGLKALDGIDAEPEASDFGSLAHRAIQALTLHWNTHAQAADDATLAMLADAALRDFSDRPNVAIFWRQRLLRALDFVNAEEEQRRGNLSTVKPEAPCEAVVAGIALHGRIDRLEEGAAGRVVVDYKTGATPSEKQILDGKALQLLAYRMLLEAVPSAPVTAVEYWQLPHGRNQGEVRRVEASALDAAGLPEKLQALLASMQRAETPFLARVNNDTGYENDYDGISRYDEWAG